MRAFRNQRSYQRGQVMVLMAGAFGLLLILAALVINLGEGQLNKRIDQNVADAAALAAGYSLYSGDTGSNWMSGANKLAESQLGVAGLPNSDLTITYYSGAYPGGTPTTSPGAGASITYVVVTINNHSTPDQFGSGGVITVAASAAANVGSSGVPPDLVN